MDKDLAEQLELIELPEEMKGSSNKRALDEIKVMLVRIFAITAYGIILKKACNGEMNDTLQVESAWEPQSFSVLN